jgi:ABC-type dipeptide/oligopeptide/nickel transport system permease component
LLKIIFKKLIFIPVASFFVSSLAFIVVNLTPGDPVEVIAGGIASEETKQAIRVELGLDQSIYERYINYIGDLLHGDLGNSFYTKIPVIDSINQYLFDTFELIIMSLIIALLLGFLIGGVGAYFRGKLPDRLSNILLSIIQSVPDFFLGLLLIYLFFYKLELVPAPIGRIGLSDVPPEEITGGLLIDSILTRNWEIFKVGLKHAILPSVTLGIFYSSYFGRTARNVLGNSLNSKQVEFAKSLGLSKFRMFIYALVDARTPILTYIAILFAGLFGACAIIETVFAWNGIGSWAITKIMMLDIPAIQGFILFAGLITLFTYTFLDILITYLDPRIRKKTL